MLRGADDACKYYYKDSADAEQLLNEEFCECSLMESEPETGTLPPEALVYLPLAINTTATPRERIGYGTGHCPTPTQLEINNFVGNYSILIEKAVDKVHSHDRYNWEALSEILVG